MAEPARFSLGAIKSLPVIDSSNAKSCPYSLSVYGDFMRAGLTSFLGSPFGSFSRQSLRFQPRAVFVKGFLSLFLIGQSRLGLDLPGCISEFKLGAHPTSSFLLNHKCRLHNYH
jgi:hypothetical protein